MIGKWHLSAEPSSFDYYCVLPGQGWYHNPEFRVRGPKKWPNNTRRVKKHSSDAITDTAINWLKSRQDKTRPFFLMHHFKAPHDDFENAERFDFLYNDIEIPEPESLRIRKNHGPQNRKAYGTSVSKRNQRRNMGHHMFVDKSLSDDEYTGETYQRYLKKYLRCVKGVDENVGRLIQYLKSSGQYENTIVIYTSDQGFMLGEHDYIDKRWMYEESLRMPFIVRWPNRIPAGTRIFDMINNVDFAPTIVEMAGGEQLISQLGEDAKFQGRSFASNLCGNTPGDWPKACYYRYWMHMAHHDNPAHFGIRTENRKLIFFYGQRLKDEWFWNPERCEPTKPYWEFYDLAEDPQEMNNLIGDSNRANEIKELKNELFKLRAKVGDTDQQFPEMQTIINDAFMPDETPIN